MIFLNLPSFLIDCMHVITRQGKVIGNQINLARYSVSCQMSTSFAGRDN
jgi:hypothetical protein